VAGGLLACGLLFASIAAAVAPSPPFTQCPQIGADSGCGTLIVVNPDRTVSVYSDSATKPYDGGDDTLVGFENRSSFPVPAITAYGTSGSNLFGFDGDGICTYTFTGNDYCSHLPAPPASTGYEGPGTSFINDPSTHDDGEIDLAPQAGGPGNHTYFSLEGAVTAADLTVRLGSLLHPFHMVVMGDSYSSGEGTYNAHTNSVDYYSDSATAGDTCHRSAGAYGPLLGVAGDDGSQLQDVLACSGASIQQIENGRSGEPPQVAALAAKAAASPVTTVALTASGDSLGFTAVLQACSYSIIPFHPHEADSVLEFICEQKLNEELAHLNTVMGELHELLAKIEAATITGVSHGATIFLLDYPHLFPDRGIDGCNGVLPRSQELLNDATNTLDEEMERVANEFPYVRFVEVRGAFHGHPVCGSSAPYINDLQFNGPAVMNCPNNYLAFTFAPNGVVVGGVCSQSYHPNTAGWAAEAALLRKEISGYETTAGKTSCVSKLRPYSYTGPGVAGDYRLGEEGALFAPTSGPTSGPGPFASLGGVYADVLNCSPWVEPGSSVNAGVQLRQFKSHFSIKAGWSEAAYGKRTTMVELRDPVTEAKASRNGGLSYESCAIQSSLRTGLTCSVGFPLPPTDTGVYYTIEFHPYPVPIQRQGQFGPFTEYGSFEVFMEESGATARTKVAWAPARFIPNQSDIVGETHNMHDQMPGTPTAPEMFEDAHVFDNGAWVNFDGSVDYNGSPLDGLDTAPLYGNRASTSGPIDLSGQRIEIWDERLP